MARSWLPVLALAVLFLAASGCGGAGEEVPATPTERRPTSGRPTPVTRGATPIITDGQFEAPTKGYRVQIPDGWSARPDIASTAALTVDAFFAPDEGGPVQTNIGVTCERQDEGTSLEEYVNLKREVAAAVTGRTPEVEAREVSGREALGFTYSLESEPAVDKVEVFLLGEDCVWTIALAVPMGQLAASRPVLEEFITSFQLLP